MTLKKNQCKYYLGKIGDGSDDKFYCGKEVQYYIVKDEDGNKIRKYNVFCFKHMQEIKKGDK